MKKAMIIAISIGLFSPMRICAADTDTALDVHIRTIAASCAACHGTNGNVAPSISHDTRSLLLAGVPSSDTAEKLLAFKSGKRPATVMHRHARGLTDAEIHALAIYFSKQTVQPPVLLKPRPLQADHAH